jgi:hypothetical protein
MYPASVCYTQPAGMPAIFRYLQESWVCVPLGMLLAWNQAFMSTHFCLLHALVPLALDLLSFPRQIDQ